MTGRLLISRFTFGLAIEVPQQLAPLDTGQVLFFKTARGLGCDPSRGRFCIEALEFSTQSPHHSPSRLRKRCDA